MISLFEKNLKRMKSELTDLKTVHQRGLGTIRFFKIEQEFSLPANSGVLFRATIKSGEPEWPVCQPIATSSNGLQTVTRVSMDGQNATTVWWYVDTNNAGQVTVGLISSSEMQGIEKL